MRRLQRSSAQLRTDKTIAGLWTDLTLAVFWIRLSFFEAGVWPNFIQREGERERLQSVGIYDVVHGGGRV